MDGWISIQAIHCQVRQFLLGGENLYERTRYLKSDIFIVSSEVGDANPDYLEHEEKIRR